MTKSNKNDLKFNETGFARFVYLPLKNQLCIYILIYRAMYIIHLLTSNVVEMTNSRNGPYALKERNDIAYLPGSGRDEEPRYTVQTRANKPATTLRAYIPTSLFFYYA